MRESSRVNDAVERGFLVGYQSMPGFIHIVQRLSVLEGRSRRLASDRRGIGAVAVEGRIQVYQVNRTGVHSPHDVEVVAGPDCAVDPVRQRSCLVCHYSLCSIRG